MSECSILVVEDDTIQRRQIARALEKEGYDVLQASTGHETIRILESQSICLVLTDRKMPWMDGDWLLSYVRINYPRIPVAFATAYPEETENLKPDGILVKPFSSNTLKDLVHRLLEKENR